MAAISQSVRVGNAVVLHLPMKYISVGECSIYSITNAVYIQSRMQYIFNRGCSIYSIANAVYIQSRMQYIFNRECSIYSIADAVYIHFSGVYIGCCRTCILRQTYSPSAVRFLILHQMKLSAAEKEYSLEAVLDLSCDDLG